MENTLAINQKVASPSTTRLRALIPIGKKILITLTIGILAILILLLFLFFTKMDRKILPVTLAGSVKDSVSQAEIKNAVIKINGSETKTNEKGEFQVRGTFEDQIRLEVVAESYYPLTQDISITRSFLVSTYTLDLLLAPSEAAIVKGKIVAEKDYNFKDDKIFIDLKEFKIKEDGSFIASNLKKGDVLFEYQSLSHKDIQKKISILEGENLIEDLTTYISGDIIGNFKDWVNDSTPMKATIQIDNVSTSQIYVLDSGDFSVKDLDANQEYTVRISHPNYISRDYPITIKKGSNQIFNLRMIPNNILASYVKDLDSKGIQIMSSELDGANEKQLTDIRSFEPSFFDHDKLKIYFRDDYERLRGLNSNTLSIGYSIDLRTGQKTLLTNTTKDLQNIYYFYKGNKLINIISKRVNRETQGKMEIRSLDGNNPVEITSGNDLNFTNLQVARDVDKVFYTLRKANTKIDDLYSWDKASGKTQLEITEEQITLFDVSAGGEQLLLSRKNSSTGFEDLLVYDIQARSSKILLQNHDGNAYKFDENSKEIFYFYAKRDGRSNIFKYDLKNNSTTRVTFINPDEDISSFYIVDRYIFYTINQKLYVLDKNISVSYKLVTSDINTD